MTWLYRVPNWGVDVSGLAGLSKQAALQKDVIRVQDRMISSDLNDFLAMGKLMCHMDAAAC